MQFLLNKASEFVAAPQHGGGEAGCSSEKA